MNSTFRSTLDLIPNGILIIDRKTMAISYANKEMANLVNNERGQAPNMNILHIQSQLTYFLLKEQTENNDDEGSHSYGSTSSASA